jgi:hypothetical protein
MASVDPANPQFRRVNACHAPGADPDGNMRRVEPEVYLTEDEPLVFYTATIKESVTDPVPGICQAHSSTLRAARTGLPSPRAP